MGIYGDFHGMYYHGGCEWDLIEPDTKHDDQYVPTHIYIILTIMIVIIIIVTLIIIVMVIIRTITIIVIIIL